MQQQRILREVARLTTEPPAGISVSPRDDTLKVLEVQMIGPDDTPYQKGVFKLEVYIPELYPFTPPSIKFVTKIYHPNIDNNGRICLDVLKLPPPGSWKPTIGLGAVLISIRMLLQNPNPDDPLMGEIGEEYKNMKDEFMKKAKMFTENFAC